MSKSPSAMRSVLSIAALLLLLAGGAGAADQFLPGIEDLPVMPGLEPERNASVVFDSPAGRIVEAYAAGNVTQEAVRAFYLKTLPQLGWTAQTETMFEREGESLRLEFGGDDGALTVRFLLLPEPDGRGTAGSG